MISGLGRNVQGKSKKLGYLAVPESKKVSESTKVKRLQKLNLKSFTLVEGELFEYLKNNHCINHWIKTHQVTLNFYADNNSKKKNSIKK